jgi:hypothetical protein
MTGEGQLERDVWFVIAVGHCLQVAGEAAVGFGILGFAEAARDFLLDLAHAQVLVLRVVQRNADCGSPRTLGAISASSFPTNFG